MDKSIINQYVRHVNTGGKHRSLVDYLKHSNLVSVTCCKGKPPTGIIRAAAQALHDNLVHGGGPSFHVKPKRDCLEMESPVVKKRILGGQRPARRNR